MKKGYKYKNNKILLVDTNITIFGIYKINLVV